MFKLEKKEYDNSIGMVRLQLSCPAENLAVDWVFHYSHLAITSPDYVMVGTLTMLLQAMVDKIEGVAYTKVQATEIITELLTALTTEGAFK